MRRKKLESGADMRSRDDSLGSYTGVKPQNKFEKPEQDADDL